MVPARFPVRSFLHPSCHSHSLVTHCRSINSLAHFIVYIVIPRTHYFTSDTFSYLSLRMIRGEEEYCGYTAISRRGHVTYRRVLVRLVLPLSLFPQSSTTRLR